MAACDVLWNNLQPSLLQATIVSFGEGSHLSWKKESIIDKIREERVTVMSCWNTLVMKHLLVLDFMNSTYV